MSVRALSIHGHFYQPPRENPFTGKIPKELGADPYKNWNERILAECYQPNAELGNFEHISFNIGPTLFAWMQMYDPETCRLIAAQDQANVRNYGVGNALAQAYNHTILPLATLQDKRTQVLWGIADFEQRMKRKPQGLWLPECAVDLETLEVLAQHDILFTILAPWQAASAGLDISEPYQVALESGRSITVFFYHQELSAGVSFNATLTSDADAFVEGQILSQYNPEKIWRGEPQLLLIASDGELYGHHQQFRDRFLARLINGASQGRGVTRSYPALWLKLYPPRQAVQIREHTSWSCHHGLQRWQQDCECTPGDGVWKAHLRRALDHLAKELDGVYEEVACACGADPWQLRNLYIQVLLGNVSCEELLNSHTGRDLTTPQLQRLELLLRAQFERQRMFTSCGWFFEDFARIEPKNNLAYAAQAAWLTWQATQVNLSDGMLLDLKRVVSQRTGLTGDQVFQMYWDRIAVPEPAR